jgi:hypothetical protein
MNRWQALVETVRILTERKRPGLAFATVCLFTLPIVIAVIVTQLVFG